jgi:hypothetical protein
MNPGKTKKELHHQDGHEYHDSSDDERTHHKIDDNGDFQGPTKGNVLYILLHGNKFSEEDQTQLSSNYGENNIECEIVQVEFREGH